MSHYFPKYTITDGERGVGWGPMRCVFIMSRTAAAAATPHSDPKGFTSKGTIITPCVCVYKDVNTAATAALHHHRRHRGEIRFE